MRADQRVVYVAIMGCCVWNSVSAWVPPSREALDLQSAIYTAISHRQASIRLPPGVVYFNDVGLNITNAHGLSIDGTTTLMFRPGVGIQIQNSSNVTLSGVTVDYSPLPFCHGAVIAPGNRNCTVRLGQDSLTFESLVKNYPPHDTWPPVTAYAAGTLDHKAGVGRWGHAPSATLLSGRDYTVHGNCKDLVVGDVIVAATRVCG